MQILHHGFTCHILVIGKENHSTVWEHARLLLVVCQKTFKRQVCIGRYTVNGQGSRNDPDWTPAFWSSWLCSSCRSTSAWPPWIRLWGFCPSPASAWWCLKYGGRWTIHSSHRFIKLRPASMSWLTRAGDPKKHSHTAAPHDMSGFPSFAHTLLGHRAWKRQCHRCNWLVFKVLRGRCSDAAFNSRVLPRAGARFPPGPPQKEIARNFAQNVFWQFFLSFGPLKP